MGAPAPTLGCEIAPGGIVVARWNEGATQLSTTAWRPLVEGAIDPTPLRENLTQPERVRESLTGCLDSLGLRGNGHGMGQGNGHGKRADAALVLPDQAARLFVLDFDKLPRNTPEAIELVRWRLKKSVPFDIDACSVSFTAHRREAGWQVISVVTPHSVVRQYEELLTSVGLNPTRVTLSTLAAMPLLPDAPEGGSSSSLLVKLSPPWLTTVIVQGSDLCLFRTGALGGSSGHGSGELAPAAILEAIYPSFAYFQDTFGRSLDHVYLCGLGEATNSVAEAIAAEMHVPAQPLLSAGDAAPTGSANWSRADAERYSAALLGLLRE